MAADAFNLPEWIPTVAAITALASVARTAIACLRSYLQQWLELQAVQAILKDAPPGSSCEYDRPGGLRFSVHANPHDPRAEAAPASELLSPQSVPEEREP